MRKNRIVLVAAAILAVCLCFVGAYILSREDVSLPPGVSGSAPGGEGELVPGAGDSELAPAAQAVTEPAQIISSSDNGTGETADNAFGSEIVKMPNDASWKLVLLNRDFCMTNSYSPTLTAPLQDSACKLDARVSDAFRLMYTAAQADGIPLSIAAGYVSVMRQEQMYRDAAADLIAGGTDVSTALQQAAFTALPGGCSENNIGIAVDLGWFDQSFAKSPMYAWLCIHAADYGFIERYEKEKESVTRVAAAPWHWRFVGREAAAEMKAQNLCLEEYLGRAGAATPAAPAREVG